MDRRRRELERRAAAEGDPEAKQALLVEDVRAGLAESGIGMPDAEYVLVKGETYAAGLDNLRNAAQGDQYHPRSMLAGRPRPLLFRENLDVRKIVLSSLKEAMVQGLEDFETDYIGGELIPPKQRAKKFWDTWLDSSAAHHYNSKDTDKFTLIDVCEDLLGLTASDIRECIPKAYDQSQGAEFDRSNGTLYNTPLSRIQAISHEWWVENAGSSRQVGEYFDAVMEARKILHPEWEKREEIMGVYLPNKERVNELGDHLRQVFVNNLSGNSDADANNVLNDIARFARVALK